MTKYLYGANVKAVQQFIFQTNKLTEIIGASELVEQICTSLFRSRIGKSEEEEDPNCIIAAAGVIKYIFDDETSCQKLVRKFPKLVFEIAPGIVFNQAVVMLASDQPTNEELKELEQRLKTQRNKAVPPLETGLRIMVRSRRTGLPAIKYEGNEALDLATDLKQEANKIGKESLGKKLSDKALKFVFPSDIKKIASEGNYIAVIHADGNNLGKAIRDLNESMGKPESEQQNSTARNRDFSLAIEEATLAAARSAIQETFKTHISISKEKDGVKTVEIPMRPVILGGDDFTIICNAEYALGLTQTFLAKFHEKSKDAFKDKESLKNLPPLTACAGIAYIKTNYPFHYGAKLAEDLCAFSKKVAKEKNPNTVPACLTFHRVQSSFVGEYKELIERELTAPATGISFCSGPYFINSFEPTVSNLMEQVKILASGEVPVSKLRMWIKTCYISKYSAIEDLDRIIELLNEKGKIKYVETLKLDTLLKEILAGESKTNLYDVINIYSLTLKHYKYGNNKI